MPKRPVSLAAVIGLVSIAIVGILMGVMEVALACIGGIPVIAIKVLDKEGK